MFLRFYPDVDVFSGIKGVFVGVFKPGLPGTIGIVQGGCIYFGCQVVCYRNKECHSQDDHIFHVVKIFVFINLIVYSLLWHGNPGMSCLIKILTIS
jgi:hypothetical protein